MSILQTLLKSSLKPYHITPVTLEKRFWTEISWGKAITTCRLRTKCLQTTEIQEDEQTTIENQAKAVIRNSGTEAVPILPSSQTCLFLHEQTEPAKRSRLPSTEKIVRVD